MARSRAYQSAVEAGAVDYATWHVRRRKHATTIAGLLEERYPALSRDDALSIVADAREIRDAGTRLRRKGSSDVVRPESAPVHPGRRRPGGAREPRATVETVVTWDDPGRVGPRMAQIDVEMSGDMTVADIMAAVAEALTDSDSAYLANAAVDPESVGLTVDILGFFRTR